jgi:translation initiation factor 4A
LCLGEFLKIKVHMCCGGTTIAVDKKILSEGVHIVVG